MAYIAVTGNTGEGAFVLEHELADGEFVGVGRGQQFVAAMEGEGNGGLWLVAGSLAAVFYDETRR